MRDLFFLALLPVLLYLMVQRPFIAVGMSLWTALFFPNAWLWGIAATLRYNLLFAGAAVVGYVALRDKPKVQLGMLGALVLLFFAWTTLSSSMTLGQPELVWEIWSRFGKVVLLFLFIAFVLDKQLHVDFVLCCVVLSVGFYAGLEALKVLATGGAHLVAGLPGHALGDRNELALAFVMTLPICAYLRCQYGRQSVTVRAGLAILMMLILVAVVGTHSRGGFVALLGLASYMFLKSRRKLLLALLLLALAAVLTSLAPEAWTTRMQTLGAAEDDASFLGRLVAWKLSFLLAMEHPWFGGGFKALEYFPVWEALSRDVALYPWFSTGSAVPDPKLAHAAHSMLFQVLGEHGFVGLGLYLAILGRAILGVRRAGKLAAGVAQAGWIGQLATVLQLCLWTFFVGGAALNVAYFELTFALFGIVIVLETRLAPRACQQLATVSAAQSQIAGRAHSLA